MNMLQPSTCCASKYIGLDSVNVALLKYLFLQKESKEVGSRRKAGGEML